MLAGGSGSRFWPVSTPTRPKQLLPLASDRPLIVDTIERARAVTSDERIRILAPQRLRGVLQETLPDFPEDGFWSEPAPRGTAPALAWAAWRIRSIDPDAVMISLHADHVIRPPESLTALLRSAARVARTQSLLLTVGAPPDRAETGYGYIEMGERLTGELGVEAYRVSSFHEKPDASVAARYVASGYLWNTGIFVWSVGTFLDELKLHAPALGDRLALLEQGDTAGFFESVPEVTVDVALLEKSRRVGVVRANFRWDDVGSWEALSRSRATDEAGNVVHGDTHLVESSGNVVYSEEAPVVLFGVDDLIVVRTRGVTLVASRSRAADLKHMLAQLPESLRRLDGE